LVGTMLGGFAATAWQRRNPAGYAWVLAGSILLATPFAAAALLVEDRTLAMGFLATAIFLLFLSTGPTNTLILETVPVNLRASAMAMSLFLIHLFGDMWSSQIVGAVADHFHSLRTGVMVLPAALVVGGVLWFALALKMRKDARSSSGQAGAS